MPRISPILESHGHDLGRPVADGDQVRVEHVLVLIGIKITAYCDGNTLTARCDPPALRPL
jgi:hypothetical protein